MPGGLAPPKPSAAGEVPADAIESLAAFKLLTSVQLEPFHNSVSVTQLGEAGGGSNPPKHKAAVLFAHVVAALYLALFKSATSVQELPFQVSQRAKPPSTPVGFAPLANKADV